MGVDAPSVCGGTVRLRRGKLVQNRVMGRKGVPRGIVCSLASTKRTRFRQLVFRVSRGPVGVFLSFGTIVIGLSSLPPRGRGSYVTRVRRGVDALGSCLRCGVRGGRGRPDVPTANVTILHRRCMLIRTVRT